MASISTVESVPVARTTNHTPGRTGARTPKPAVEQNVKHPVTKPQISVTFKCIPKAYAYPKYLKVPIGPNEKGRYHLVRYACLKTTIRWLKAQRAMAQRQLAHSFPMDLMPVGLLDQNPAPVSGGIRVQANRASSIKEYVVPDDLE